MLVITHVARDASAVIGRGPSIRHRRVRALFVDESGSPASAKVKESEDAMSIKLEPPQLTELRPRIVVVGVGGAGGNAINNMIASGLTGVEYIAANTDAQALAASSAERRLQLGATVTEGLGAGARPEIGHAAAEETIEEIRAEFAGAHMAFIAAGMGGGTGTGAASVIAKTVKEMGLLTVAIVSKPFEFEGTRRMRVAEAGIEELRKHVDTLIVIPNQNLFRIANERTTFAEAFVLADQILYSGIASVVDLILKDGLINLDFADVRTIMSGMGTAVMGTGHAEGAERATVAADEAIANPLLDNIKLADAMGVLISIVGGPDMTLFEVDEAVNRIRREVDAEANIIVGAAFDTNLSNQIRVSILASGMDQSKPETVPEQSEDHTASRAHATSQRAQPAGGTTDSTGAQRYNRGHSSANGEHAHGQASNGGFGEGAPPPLPASILFSMDPAEPSRALRFPTPKTASMASQQAQATEPQHRPADHPGQAAAPSASARRLHEKAVATEHGGGPTQSQTWRSSDGVYVEPIGRDGRQPSSAQASGSEAGAQRSADAGDDDPRPGAPQDIARGPTRMPSVSDFAPHAQREYFAKSRQAGENVASSQRSGGGGLFGALSRFGGNGESAASGNASDGPGGDRHVAARGGAGTRRR